MTVIQLMVFMLLIHFLADFGLQTHDQATKKGEGNEFLNKWLGYHVGVYTLVWSIAYFVIPTVEFEYPVRMFMVFATYIFVTHYITDWITSRISKPFFSNGDFHNGFVTVGMDQVVHYLTLIPALLFITGNV